ncbi:hypothetical protein OS493_010401 [Desmophyllum pertusum]|uniref:Uncharacterized protein n=1 Tax=Desmophyllum pertusum TaxID=174260 RepID=A0A9X0A3L1_9CNID|nr:hypothetical protein OS493_010401 [Desmophyllum pertusum]
MHTLVSSEGFYLRKSSGQSGFVNNRPVKEKAFFAEVLFGREPGQVVSRVLQEGSRKNFLQSLCSRRRGGLEREYLSDRASSPQSDVSSFLEMLLSLVSGSN